MVRLDRKMSARAVVAALVGAIVFAATGALYRGSREVVVDFQKAYEGGFISEFHGRERADDGYFRWTTDASYLDFHHLPKTGPVNVEALLRVRRPGGEPRPNVAFTVNGTAVERVVSLPGRAVYPFAFPASRSGMRLGIRSDTFDPNGTGTRLLGVQVLGVTLAFPDNPPSWLAPSLLMGSAAMLFFAAASVAGATPLWAGLSSLVIASGFVFLLAQHALRFSSYPRDVALLAAATLAVLVFLRFVLAKLDWLHSSSRVWVLASLGLILLLEMAVVFYPLRVSSDADFQANRMLHFLEGNWHPTSVTQHHPPFDIPYPVSLYATAAPLVLLGADRVVSLSFMTGLFDVFVSIVLIYLGWRFLDDLRAGILAGILYQLVPVNALSFSAGNFTNLFAVAALSLAFVFMFSSPVICAFWTFVALTAHLGMLIEGAILWPAWLFFFWLAPTPANDQRKRLTLALTVAALLAGVYYFGYWELFTSQWDRALERDAATVAAGPSSKLADLGWVFVVVAALGALSLAKRPFSSAFRGAAATWLGVTVVFAVIDTLSAIEIRYVLQALPLLALCAGAYLSKALERGWRGKTAALAATLYLVFLGFRTLYEVLLTRYH